ncbi:MAG TPA: glycosyltransferase, partial [Candidatus Limnocylindria bacterium]
REIPGGQALDPHRPVVLYLGGLMGGRGLEELVTAMVEVPEGQLVLVGDGVLGEPLRRQAADLGIGDRVHLLDPVPPGDVVSVAASADVGVSPIVPSCLNYRYSLPNKLFQYLAAGVPVVASDFPQVRDVVAGADAGLLVDTSRPPAIAAAIRELLADPARRAAMGKRGRAAVADRLNWSTSATALLRVYREVGARRQAG